MALLDKFFTAPQKQKAKSEYAGMSWTLINGQFVSDDDKNHTYIDKGYKQLPNLYAIISLIAQKCSMIPIEVYKVQNNSKYNRYKAQLKNSTTTKDLAKAQITKAQALDRIEDSDLEKLLLKPNDYQDGSELIENVMGYLLLTGNAYLYGTNAISSKPDQIHSLISPAVTIKSGKSYREPVMGYACEYINEFIKPEEIGHIKYQNYQSSNIKSEDFLYGMPPLKSCRNLLGKYYQADIAQGTFFNNMSPSGVLAMRSDNGLTFDEEQATSLKNKFHQEYQGSDKAGSIVITTADLQWQQIGLSPVDLNIIEGKKEILEELCNVFHAPQELFIGDKKFNNFEQARRSLITDAIIPNMEKLKSMLNRWLAPKFGEGLAVEFDYTVFSEMNEDMEMLAKSLSQMNFLSYNEKRAVAGYEESKEDGADSLFVPNSLVRLSETSSDLDMVDEQMLDE